MPSSALKVLITGGGGFIGCRLSGILIAAGHDVVVVDVLHPQVHPLRMRPIDLHADVRFIPGDVTVAETWRPILNLSEPDVVVHLAAETGTGQSLAEASRHGMVNVVGTTRMLDALYQMPTRPEHIVLASSRAVYGDGAWRSSSGRLQYPGVRTHRALSLAQWDHSGDDGEPWTAVPSSAATTQPHPTNIYAATKLAQEHMIQAWCAASDMKSSILRLQNVYGPGQSIGNTYTGVLTYFANQIAKGEAIEVYEDGEIVRDFVFVSDVAKALLAAIEHPPETSRTLDIGSGAATTILEVARSMARLSGGLDPRISGKFRDGDVRAASCSIEAAGVELGYEPATHLESGISQLLDWATTCGGQ